MWVSDEPWPPSERLDGSVLFAAADDQCAAAQPQGVRSASRLLGQLLTSCSTVEDDQTLEPRRAHQTRRACSSMAARPEFRTRGWCSTSKSEAA